MTEPVTQTTPVRQTLRAVLALCLCICFAVLGLLGAVSAGAWNAKWLTRCVEQTGYLGVMQQSAVDAVGILCQNAGMEPGLAQQFITEETMRTDFAAGVDALYHGGAAATITRMQHVSALAQETAAAGGQTLSQEQKSLYDNLQLLCEQAYDSAVAVPFSAFLSELLQLKMLQIPLLVILLAVCFVLFLLLRRVCAGRMLAQTCAQSLLGAGLSLGVCAAAVAFSVPKAAAWMPQTNPAHTVYTAWLSGIAPLLLAVGLCAGCLAAAVLLLLTFRRAE